MPLDGVGLHVGVPTKVADAIVATGLARVRPFNFVAPPGPHKIVLQQVGATVLTLDVEMSSDFGTTWKKLQATAFDLVAAVASFEAFPGVQYRTNVLTLTTTPADIFATAF